MNDLERIWDRNGNKSTRICAKHRKIDCKQCMKTCEWDELLRRISKPQSRK